MVSRLVSDEELASISAAGLGKGLMVAKKQQKFRFVKDQR